MYILIIIFLAPPKLTREPEDQRIPLGETLKVKIPINGKGPFTFKLKKDDRPLADSDRVRIQEYDDCIVVTIPGLYFLFLFNFFIHIHLFSDIERDDAGKYAINVANDSGSCNVPLKVKVIGTINQINKNKTRKFFFHSSTTSSNWST